MNRHTEHVLEFSAVRHVLMELCRSCEGRRTVEGAGFHTTEQALVDRLNAVSEAETRLRVGTDPRAQFPDISRAVEQVAVEGAVLDEPDIADLSGYIISAAHLLQEFRSQEGEYPTLRAVVQTKLGGIALPVSAATSIARHFTPAGRFDPDTVPELKELASVVRRLQTDILRSATAIMRAAGDAGHSGVWHSDQPTQRDGRTVLPLSADHRGRVGGIVHELSASGRTVFIEPPELLGLNNDRIEAESRLRHAVAAKLREFCSVLRTLLPDLAFIRQAVAEMDVIFAKAAYGVRHNCTRPEISRSAELRLVGARHPMLGKTAVPITVELSASTRALIISGPNTGGKTVSLKTIGLCVLMHQFGLLLPAEPGTSLPLFSYVGADIGDEQSIQASLSTFSGHIQAISQILQDADSQSLVLLDELGAGTDPEDGASLATALLEHFVQIGALCVLTTHLGALKSLAFGNESISNASMEYDQSALAPTFRVVPGVPGSSHAMEIAARSGLPRGIVSRAEQLRREGRTDIDQIIAEVLALREDARLRQQELFEERNSCERLRTELGQRARELDKRELDLRRGHIAELEEFAAASRSRLEQIIRELREGEITKEKTLQARRFAEETKARIDAEREADSVRRERLHEQQHQHRAQASSSPHSAQHTGFAINMPVRVLPEGKLGTLVRQNRDGSWVVSVGPLRLTCRADRLEYIDPPGGNAGTGASGACAGASVRYTGAPAYEFDGGTSPSGIRAAAEIDLRGKNLNDAVLELERQLDACLVAGLRTFSVIHGVGEGVLQKGVRSYLAERTEVQDVSYAVPEHGGFGKSIVTLKSD